MSAEKWDVYRYMGGMYVAIRIDGQEVQSVDLPSSTHCLACAKTSILAKRGGKVDLRGWHKQGYCGACLKAMQRAVDTEGDGLA